VQVAGDWTWVAVSNLVLSYKNRVQSYLSSCDKLSIFAMVDLNSDRILGFVVFELVDILQEIRFGFLLSTHFHKTRLSVLTKVIVRVVIPQSIILLNFFDVFLACLRQQRCRCLLKPVLGIAMF
jgi:hypothetical protein